MELRGRFSIAAKRMSRSIIRELLKLAGKPGLISFAGGLPFAGSFPAGEIREACARVLQDSPEVPCSTAPPRACRSCGTCWYRSSLDMA
jgi:DNA-binding transcriptional MocR family regulator